MVEEQGLHQHSMRVILGWVNGAALGVGRPEGLHHGLQPQGQMGGNRAGPVYPSPALGAGRCCLGQLPTQEALPWPPPWLRQLGKGLCHQSAGCRLQVHVSDATLWPCKAGHYPRGQQPYMTLPCQADVLGVGGPGGKVVHDELQAAQLLGCDGHKAEVVR